MKKSLARIQRLVDTKRYTGVIKKKKEAKQSYIPGSIGISSVSETILEDYGRIVSRKERKKIAREGGQKFIPVRSF